jgi:hypothetical protein
MRHRFYLRTQSHDVPYLKFPNIAVAVKKFPEYFDTDGLAPHDFVPPGQCYRPFLRVSIAQVARCSSEVAARSASVTAGSVSR